MRNRVQSGRNTKNNTHAHLLGIPELLESRILGIPVVAIVTSRTRSLRDPIQQDFIHARTLPIYMCHTRLKF